MASDPRPPSRSLPLRTARPVVPFLFALLGVVAGLFAPGAATPAQAATTGGDAKVVIIVGATHGATSTYRDRANAAYAEAIKYTPNVVKVYSPNATWSKVKAATAGASIVIYMGHGNGWPSPYTYDPEYTTKNGFGLNETAGNGDYNNKYYGEPYIEQLDLAPDALIMLHHLCYAAGNSEPGHADPSLSDAKKRVDNYASAFLRAGAAAVLADGHRGPVEYLRDLFTTDQTLDAWWKGQSNANGNEFSFASTRTSGATAMMDPEATGKYYRALTGDPTTRTTDVVAGDPNALSAADYPVLNVFGDIWTSSFVASIQWIYDEGITGGCAPDAYCPKSPVTRGQMASFLARALELPPGTKDYFTDDDGLTHEADINRLAESGITGGCGDGLFCRTASVSRAQMAAFLVRALDLPPSTTDYFSDDDDDTLESSINALAQAGLTGGCGNGKYCHDASVSREQMAAFLKRALAGS
jgi:hypothetical protein